MLAAWQEDQARMRAYVVRRHYQLRDKHDQPTAQIVASIAYQPPNQEQYNIESTTGGIGGRVLRDIIQRETEASRAAPRPEISPQNYEFELAGREKISGHDCYVLSLIPKRDEKNLIRGKIWIDAVDYRIHRLEGNPVKSPSWWIRDLHILMTFSSVDGMWLHTFTHAVAEVRLRGTYVMESRDLEYRSGEQTAQRHKNPGVLAGTFIDP
jgi:hypothetical protein